jgi:hypothetical protein
MPARMAEQSVLTTSEDGPGGHRRGRGASGLTTVFAASV